MSPPMSRAPMPPPTLNESEKIPLANPTRSGALTLGRNPSTIDDEALASDVARASAPSTHTSPRFQGTNRKLIPVTTMTAPATRELLLPIADRNRELTRTMMGSDTAAIAAAFNPADEIDIPKTLVRYAGVQMTSVIQPTPTSAAAGMSHRVGDIDELRLVEGSPRGTGSRTVTNQMIPARIRTTAATLNTAAVPPTPL